MSTLYPSFKKRNARKAKGAEKLPFYNPVLIIEAFKATLFSMHRTQITDTAALEEGKADLTVIWNYAMQFIADINLVRVSEMNVRINTFKEKNPAVYKILCEHLGVDSLLLDENKCDRSWYDNAKGSLKKENSTCF